ncbi:hypothetical protein Dsin_014389 [Dipteronia sinensis]|uniref:4-coumarate--CoA ligase n=1 Tax=Dipteronia sinensis TaxID=43782 RepID=A0AAE0E9Z3_9ROSI|nr:hypothetical protein Dsin_014389 [Dipteronia sinensis]
MPGSYNMRVKNKSTVMYYMYKFSGFGSQHSNVRDNDINGEEVQFCNRASKSLRKSSLHTFEAPYIFHSNRSATSLIEALVLNFYKCLEANITKNHSQPVRIHFFLSDGSRQRLLFTNKNLPQPKTNNSGSPATISASFYHGICFLTSSTAVAPPPLPPLLMFPDPKTFMINDATGHRLTYSDLLLQTNSLAISLSKHYSLSKGDVAFILSPHSLQIPIIYFSLLSLGVIISPANPDDSGSDITHLLNLSRPVIIFATSETSHKLIINPTWNCRTVLMDSPEFLSLLTPSDDDNSIINHSDDVVNQSDVAAIIYSSGTSGPNKGVQLTHRNLIAGMTTTTGADKYYHKQLVSLATRALAGVFGFTVMMRAISREETLVLLPMTELETILEAVDRYKANYMPVSPSEIVALLKSDLTNKYDLSSLMFLGCGGAPLSEDVAAKFRDKFPTVQILRGYGLTETGGMAAATKGPVEVTRLDSVGRLAEHMEAKIVDRITGEALFPGQEGELWLRGPNIMKEGWLKTGDLCYFDSQGLLFIVSRLKELIKYKAFQVPPAELEHLLLSIPEIADAAVIPYVYPDEDVGQIPMAFVVRKLGSNITESQVMEFIAKQVAPYKQIRRIAFIDSIPRSHAGKILRRELIDRALSAN